MRAFFLPLAKFTRALVSDEAVRNVAKRVLQRLTINRERFQKPRFNEFQIAAQTSAGEERERDRRAELPRPCATGEKIGQGHGLIPVKTRKGDLRIKCGLGLADVRIGRDQLLLGRANVRTPFQKARGQTGRHFSTHGLIGQ